MHTSYGLAKITSKTLRTLFVSLNASSTCHTPTHMRHIYPPSLPVIAPTLPHLFFSPFISFGKASPTALINVFPIGANPPLHQKVLNRNFATTAETGSVRDLLRWKDTFEVVGIPAREYTFADARPSFFTSFNQPYNNCFASQISNDTSAYLIHIFPSRAGGFRIVGGY